MEVRKTSHLYFSFKLYIISGHDVYYFSHTVGKLSINTHTKKTHTHRHTQHTHRHSQHTHRDTHRHTHTDIYIYIKRERREEEREKERIGNHLPLKR